jgi:hypothetical protein
MKSLSILILLLFVLVVGMGCTGLRNLQPTVGSTKPALVKDSTKTVKP